MISQPKYNFVFVAVSKTGCSSMHNRFRHAGCCPRGTDKDRYPGIEFVHPLHYNIKEYRQILGDELDTRFKFGFVRNPWDKIVSSYTRTCNSWQNSRIPRDGVNDGKIVPRQKKTNNTSQNT